MKYLIRSFLFTILISSCSDDDTTERSRIKIIANASEITDTGYVKTWVLNTATYERQWVLLKRSTSSPKLWEGEVILEAGEYTLETLVQSVEGEPTGMVAYVDYANFKVKENMTIFFDHFQDNGRFNLHDFSNHTVLTATDPCDFSYKIYVGKDLCATYFYIDRFFWGNGGSIEAYSTKELVIGDGSCLEVDPEVEHIVDIGMITGTMPRINQSDCAGAVESAVIVDQTTITGGVLSNGLYLEDSFGFVVFK